MIKEKRHRIKYYSKEDLAAGNELSRAETLLEKYLPSADFTINDLLEFYNIKLYFQNELFLAAWTESQKREYEIVVEQVFGKLKKVVYSINDDSIEMYLSEVEYKYLGTFWRLLNNLNDFKKISEQVFSKTLTFNKHQLNYVLKQKKIVTRFNKPIRDFMITNSKSAEIILSSLEEKEDFTPKEIRFFPKSLSLTDKESILTDYLDSEDPNLNYVRLIENSRNTKAIKLSPKTRLKAKKKSKELNEKILSGDYTWSDEIQVSFLKNQKEPVIFDSERTGLKASYSEDLINGLSDNISLFNVFKNLFCYTDEKGLITLVSKKSELDVLERTLIKSKNEYEIGVLFRRKELFAFVQMIAFRHYLNRKGKSLEELINSYVDFVSEKIRPESFIFKLPLNKMTYLDRIKIISPDFEFLLKQYKAFVDEQEIDIELIQIDSTPIRLSELRSTKSKKYLYANSDLILRLMHVFFSDQSHLSYVKSFENKYHCLYDLIINENVKLEAFRAYQKEAIQRLINEGYLKLNKKEYVILNNEILIFLIGELHYKEVLSYWHYPVDYRIVMDRLEQDKLLISENTLFTRYEKNYFNFHLNKKEFTNGYDLRNKYVHGTFAFSEKNHEADYYSFLKLIILTLFKISEDISKS